MNTFKTYPRPLIIAGPCSAESSAQMRATALGLSQQAKIDFFRAGIWKPRTRPNAFEGAGKEGLVWLNEVKQEFGYKTATEVANAEHVELCLKSGVDLLWIGARTTVNPFSVQEIADALKGVDIPVMIKNPIHPELALWIGAIERIKNAGITSIAAIHRGFFTVNKINYRNLPTWELALQLKMQMPDMTILCDPSHICGRRDTLLKVAQKAMDLNMDGLMIETHYDPNIALSDAEQQVTPEGLKQILNQIVYRNGTLDNPTVINALELLRKEIDLIDENILSDLHRRDKVIRKIGEYKTQNNLSIFQLERWKEIMESRKAIAKTMGLREEFIDKIFMLLHKESIKTQTELMNDNAK